MFVGTGSDVGKSVVNAAFCRIFLQDGYAPAPFKAQNMSLNSYATKENLEIGRAQAVQAEACGIECSVDMNPVLLKPTNSKTSQVILNGKPAGNKSAMDYFNKSNRDELFVEAVAAFDRLSSKYNPIVLEGAGSISEVNLWDKDIVNMKMAQSAGAATYLIADIDKGGVFASVYGSIMLLPKEQRELIKGVIINKFRGDIRLFEEGKKIMKELTGVPVVGVIPYFRDIFVEQEDSVVLDSIKKGSGEQKIKIAVVLLKSMSNFTDFNILERVPQVNLFYAVNPSELKEADIVIIPGSKNTIADLTYLRSRGFVQAIQLHHKEGKPLYGICGGYQMMGDWIYDPEHIEGAVESMPGLGILPISTTIEGGKTTRQCNFTFNNYAAEADRAELADVDAGREENTAAAITGSGYEIHAGITHTSRPLCTLDNGIKDGYFLNEKCWGSYIHGIFDNRAVIEQILSCVENKEFEIEDYNQMKERNYNLLADLVREVVDMEYIYETLGVE